MVLMIIPTAYGSWTPWQPAQVDADESRADMFLRFLAQTDRRSASNLSSQLRVVSSYPDFLWYDCLY